MSRRPVPIPFETIGGAGSKNSRGSPRIALVDNQYKLLTDMDEAGDSDLLFDLQADPSETTNIARQNAQIVKTMKEKLVAFRGSCASSLIGKDYVEPFMPNDEDVRPTDGSAKKKKAARK